jgi:hypothetical protein
MTSEMKQRCHKVLFCPLPYITQYVYKDAVYTYNKTLPCTTHEELSMLCIQVLILTEILERGGAMYNVYM